MTEEQRLPFRSIIDDLADDIRDLTWLLENGDGREVKAKCADMAITLFKLGEAAKEQSEQRWDQ